MKCQWAPFADAPFAFSFPASAGVIPSKGNLVVIGPILFAYSEFKDFRTDG